MEKQPSLNDIVSIFKEPEADANNIAKAGECFLVSLYNGDINNDTLDTVRYTRFAKSIKKSKCDLATLPPTRDAARNHSFRTYHQVQAWYGIEKNPQKWGWKFVNNLLTPVKTSSEPAPQTLLNVISCNCKKACMGSCGCRKAGLKCSILCGFCSGQSCENMPEVLIESENEEEEEEKLSIIEQFQDEVEHLFQH